MIVNRVEKHIVKLNNQYYKLLDEFCFRSKNLYNYANYQIRQKFCSDKEYISYNKMDTLLKQKDMDFDYRNMPTAQSAQQCLKLLDKNWQSFFKAIKDWSKAYMYDTYFDSWDSHRIQVTDENIDDFKIVFDFKEIKRIHNSEANEYNKEDLYHIATDSGGYSCGRLYWVKKNAVKSKEFLISKKKQEIESLKCQLKWAENDLKRLLND